MNQPIVIIGIGELGGVFARAFLAAGYPVYPITRAIPIAETALSVTEPKLVLVAVGEKALAEVLPTLPDSWRNKLVLLQNELLPHHWQAHLIVNPTVISVWFEKKPGIDYNEFIPSPIFGPQADFIAAALDGIGIGCERLPGEAELLQALVAKNLFVLTINICGLETGGTVNELWSQHNPLARRVAHEVIDIQEWLTKAKFDRAVLIERMVKGMMGDPGHKCTGRSAPQRLTRMMALADEAGLEIPSIRQIGALVSQGK